MATYELQACRVATLPVPGWECFFAQHDVEFYRLAFYVWIVKGDGKTGLIDTGLPLDEHDRLQLVEGCKAVHERCVFTDILTLDELFHERGLEPASIDFVLLTQTITYHSGGLLPRFFPQAHVYISRAGVFEFLLDLPGHPPRDLYFTQASWIFLRQLLVEKRLHLVDQPTQVADGIIFETTGGHHPGSAGVRVQTPHGVLGILETAFLQRNVEEVLSIGVAENAARCREVIRSYKNQCQVVLAGHDPGVLERYPEGVIR
jgi:glyoxylase-like metal-dependent hydrolase (beta-lactamase superfamily II)